MSLYSIVLIAGAVADAWIAAYAVLRLRRTLAKLALLATVVDFLVMTAAVAGVQLGALGPDWGATALWSFVLSHPLVALFLLVAVHGEDLFRRHPYVLLILAPLPLFAWLAPAGGYDVSNVYGTAPLSWYLVLCLALPLGETTAAWVRSVARKSELFVLLAGAVVLVLAGPIYAFELQAVGIAEGAGTSPGAAIAAALFVLALTFANPLPMRSVRRGAMRDANFPPGAVLLMDEARPKGSARFVSAAVAEGRPALKVVRATPTPVVAEDGPMALAAMGPARWPGSVVLATASEFLARHPGGLVYVQDLSYLATLAGLRGAHDVLLTLRRIVEGTPGTVVASLALLTPSERRDLIALPGLTALRLPDPAVEFEAILAASLAGAAGQLLRSFASRGRGRVEDLSYEDLPAIQKFLGTALAELARAPGDEPVAAGWRRTLNRVNLDLDRFARKSLFEAATGPWPSEARTGPQEDLVVRASEYWKGRELDAVVRAVSQGADRAGVGDRVRTAFVQVLGRTGDHLFESELKRLGKSPADLGPEDVARIAEASEVMIASLGSALDVAAGRADMEDRGRKLKSILAGIAEEAGHGA